MKGRCPDCGAVFEFPFEDRVNVVLFGNWKKYHMCGPKEIERWQVAIEEGR